MSLFDDFYKSLLARFSDWIKINDRMSPWTIEEFPYEAGVDSSMTYPHCWKCVTINQCWFKNENGKKPEEFNTNGPPNLYHPNCHCNKLAIAKPKISDVKFIIPDGKVAWMIKDKGHLLKELGYNESDFLEVVEKLKDLVSQEYLNGNYYIKAYDNKGFRIGLILQNFPGKRDKENKYYKIKTGWTIFPNGKLKCNTLIGGLKSWNMEIW